MTTQRKFGFEEGKNTNDDKCKAIAEAVFSVLVKDGEMPRLLVVSNY